MGCTWSFCKAIPFLAFLSMGLAGCVAIPVHFVCPALNYVPPTQSGAPPEEVRAFRVDIARSCYHRPLRSELREVPLFLGGTTSGQAQLGLIDSQRHLFTLDTWEGTKPDLEVRLYRPGWRTARVHSWELIDQISWEHAVTREEKEGAVDELLFAWYKDPPCWHLLYAEKPEGMEISPSGGEYLRAALAPGSQSKGHRDALLFAAAEYERLMISFKNDGADNKVLTPLAAKAKALRDLANE